MLFHVAPLADWAAEPTAPYRPATLATEGFVHCSADRETALRIADTHFRAVPGPLLVLVLDEARLAAEVRWAGPFPHVYGPVERAAVTEVLEVLRGTDGRAPGLVPWR
ncbi:DUF952 domain-containing protein [Streptomyces sp. MUM 203J]|uniref:DUF952 domain-containing protein n=1 Tax=Streptomyces sp. MUM 203J TaxID=2791990 RepID=UPI001F04279E|nr:DUF952 domain-containing protein [Streptomyces sp. MUM 203J]MCH0543246.1 DUF952 domain-containing protein [Streptomyces sp. MUM 203J]